MCVPNLIKIGGGREFHWLISYGMTLLFLIEVTIAASSRDPFAIDVTWADACSTFSSVNAASSAYSSLDTQTVFSPVATVTPELLMSCRRKIAAYM